MSLKIPSKCQKIHRLLLAIPEKKAQQSINKLQKKLTEGQFP